MDAHYYLFEQSGGLQLLRTDKPEPGWGRVPPDKLDVVFAAFNEGRPVRVVGEALEVADPAPQGHSMRWDWEARSWVESRDAAGAWVTVRAERDALLRASDWTQLPDIPPRTRASWTAYRQALRDITVQADPFGVVWPVAPG